MVPIAIFGTAIKDFSGLPIYHEDSSIFSRRGTCQFFFLSFFVLTGVRKR